jgi:hypothetical protein
MSCINKLSTLSIEHDIMSTQPWLHRIVGDLLGTPNNDLTSSWFKSLIIPEFQTRQTNPVGSVVEPQ